MTNQSKEDSKSEWEDWKDHPDSSISKAGFDKTGRLNGTVSIPCYYEETVERILAQQKEELEREAGESTAWCPACFDALKTVTIVKMDKHSSYIDRFEYYCEGCEETFNLTNKSDEQMESNN